MKSVVKKDDAVSPVIGTILLVAITVVLVAIVAAVVMGMTSGVQSSKDVGVTVSPVNDTTTSIVFYGGKDVSNVHNMTLVNMTGGQEVSASQDGPYSIGQPYNLATRNDFKGSTSVNLIGNFTDGTESVIYTGTINFP